MDPCLRLWVLHPGAAVLREVSTETLIFDFAKLQAIRKYAASRLQVGLQVSKLIQHRALGQGGQVGRIWNLLDHLLEFSLGVGAPWSCFRCQ